MQNEQTTCEICLNNAKTEYLIEINIKCHFQKKKY